MSEPKTTINLPFSPEDVRMGRHLGNAIAGYRDGDFKRSAEGMVDAVRAFQAAADEIYRLRADSAEFMNALLKYGQHHERCEGRDCSCGYNDILSKMYNDILSKMAKEVE